MGTVFAQAAGSGNQIVHKRLAGNRADVFDAIARLGTNRMQRLAYPWPIRRAPFLSDRLFHIGLWPNP